MKGISHAIIGTSLAFAAFRQLNINYGAAPLAASLVGSVLADVDEDDSMINSFVPLHYKKLIYLLSSCFIMYYAYNAGDIKLLLPAIVVLLIYISSHRGFTHSIIAVFLFSIPFMEYRHVFVGFAIAYLSHLVCDMVNVKGLQLLWPLTVRFRFPVHFSMNSEFGKLIEASAVLISIFVAISAM
ncbi:MAG: metal-dependent hydrolase [Caulobacteraceae bacterium]